ncbi:MAG TPA: RNA polymerase sigma factor [Polyangia bacterium]|nr:RNA polymerase sigma factor [Polyangia bacterium]
MSHPAPSPSLGAPRVSVASADLPRDAAPDPSDEVLATRARAGERAAFELLMRRHNRRVYRTIRAVLRDEAEIEDAMQEAYVSAFTHLDQFQGAARWSTWLCRIAFHEALARLRRQRRFVSIDTTNEANMNDPAHASSLDPERAAGDRELGRVLEGAIDRLPHIYRTVLMLRQVDGLSVAETAAILGVAEEVVKTRLHRARATLRNELEQRIGAQLDETYAFGAQRCDRVVAAVLARLGPGR